jgi:hypothetical protein
VDTWTRVLKKDVSIFARGAYAVSRHLGTADTRRRNVGEILDLDATIALCCGHDPNVLRYREHSQSYNTATTTTVLSAIPAVVVVVGV